MGLIFFSIYQLILSKNVICGYALELLLICKWTSSISAVWFGSLRPFPPACLAHGPSWVHQSQFYSNYVSSSEEKTLSRNKKNRHKIKAANVSPSLTCYLSLGLISEYIRGPQICVSNNAASDIKLRPSCLILFSHTDFKSTLLWMPYCQVCIAEPCHHLFEFAHLCCVFCLL